MQNSSHDRRKKIRRKSFQCQEPITLELSAGQGAEISSHGVCGGRQVSVRVKDASDSGLGLESDTSLELGSAVTVTGVVVTGLSPRKLKQEPGVIRFCEKRRDGGYFIGIELTNGAGPSKQYSAESGSNWVVDYYEVLQLNPKADPDTIHRVYRLLAQRYHPDNLETGDQAQFKILLEAYQVLSDPQKRAAYDASFTQTRQLRWKIFDQASTTDGKVAEQRKRAGVLALLYTQRLNDPRQPAMSAHELEDLLGCPREHLEFTLWYLKEESCLTRSDNGRYAITARGVNVFESDSTPTPSNGRLLPAAQPLSAAH